MLTAIAIVSLLVAAVLVGRAALSVPPRRLITGAVRMLPEVPQSPAQSRTQLEGLLPTADNVVKSMPAMDGVELLSKAPPAAAPPLDLRQVGIDDDRTAVERELWRAATRALESSAKQ